MSLHHFPQWQHLQPLQTTLFPQSTPSCSSAADTINLLTCGAAGLLPPTNSCTAATTSSPSPHHLPAIADEILTAMLASGTSTHHHKQELHESITFSEPTPVSSTQKRSFCAAFPELANDVADEDGNADDNMGQQDEKKSRRLTSEQVKALEKAFEEDNKLEPERKLELAKELGLQPRQVAIWFQNRRARWKTKQIEKDYGTLKEKFESMKAQRDALLKEKETLQAEVARLKGDVKNEVPESNLRTRQARPHPSSYFDASSVKECIDIISPASSEQKENDGSTSSDDTDVGSDIVEVVESPHQVESNVYLISKNFIDPAELLATSESLLDVPDLSYGRGNCDSEITQKLTIRNDAGGLCNEGNGGWFLPFDWWECN